MRGQKTNDAVWKAVDLAGFGAEVRAVSWTEVRAVSWSLRWDVDRAVNGAVSRAVDDAVWRAVSGAIIEDLPHPALHDFLRNIKRT